MEMIQFTLFLIEMIGFLITAIIWSLKALSRDMFMEYWVGSLVLFWVCTNFLNFLVCAARLAELGAGESMFALERFELLMIAMSPKHHEFFFLVIYSVVTLCFTCCGYSGESHGDSSCTRIAEEEEEDSSMDSFGGGEWVVCWVQRLSLLGSYGFALLLHSSTYNQGLAMLHLCFLVLFPFLIGYFTWQGYWKDFLSDDDDDDDDDDDVEESEASDVATTEDVQEESVHMEIENATEENRQKYLSESIMENKKKNSSATSAVEDVKEDVKGEVLKEMEENLMVKSEDSCRHFQEDFTERNDKCCINVVRKMLRDQEERSLQHLLKQFGNIKEDSLVSKIEDAVGKLLRIQEKRIHMKLATALEQNRHGCMGNCEDSLKKAIENSEKFKEKSEQLAWKLQLYRDLLHDPDVSISSVSS